MLKFKLAVASGNWLSRAARFAGWLVPATVCLVLAILNLGSANNLSGTAHPLLSEITLSNQNCATFWQGLTEREENSPSAHIFKWTNASALISNMRSSSFGK